MNIRNITKKDIPFCINLFDLENFNAIGMFSNQQTSYQEEIEILRKIILHETNQAKILIIEEDNKQVGYSLLTRPSQNLIHISQFLISEDKRNEGYGTILLNYIKSVAKRENCDISLQCLTPAQIFFEKNGFINTKFSKYFLPLEKNNQKPLSTKLFNYNSIISEIDEENRKEILNYQAFLKSNDYKRLTKMLEKR